MKYRIILTLACLIGYGQASSQEPQVRALQVNRTVHEQDGHFVITHLESPVYVYAMAGEAIATSTYFPFYLLREDTTATSFPGSIPGLSVFPNPVRDMLSIQRETTDDELVIELCTIDGSEVLRRAWPPGVISFQCSLSSMPPGAYVLMVTDQQRTKGNQYKIIRQ